MNNISSEFVRSLYVPQAAAKRNCCGYFVYHIKYETSCQLSIEPAYARSGWEWKARKWCVEDDANDDDDDDEDDSTGSSYNTSGYYLWNIICPIHRRYNSQSIIFCCKSSNNHISTHSTQLSFVASLLFLISVFFTSMQWHKVTFSACIFILRLHGFQQSAHYYRFHLQ